MLQHVDLHQVLFLDIETVPQYSSFAEVPDAMQALWEAKSAYPRKDATAAEYYERAGIWAEFGKIICVSVGRLTDSDGKPGMRVKSFYGVDEFQILLDVQALLVKLPAKVMICAHNGKEFDFPYLCRRFLIHGLSLPPVLDIAGKKPWEVLHLDTLELWKFGDFKNYVSLNLLAAVLNIPTPKDDLDGSMVRNVYYDDGDIERIVHYCEKDVITVAQIIRKFRGLELIVEENITIVR